MPSFRLSLGLHLDLPAITLALDATDLEAAHARAKPMIADALDRPGEFVLLDPSRGRFAVGAGLWSYNGFYRLEADEPDQPSTGHRLGLARVN